MCIWTGDLTLKLIFCNWWCWCWLMLISVTPGFFFFTYFRSHIYSNKRLSVPWLMGVWKKLAAKTGPVYRRAAVTSRPTETAAGITNTGTWQFIHLIITLYVHLNTPLNYYAKKKPTWVISWWFLADRLASRLSSRAWGAGLPSQGRLGLRVNVALNLKGERCKEEGKIGKKI